MEKQFYTIEEEWTEQVGVACGRGMGCDYNSIVVAQVTVLYFTTEARTILLQNCE